MPSCALCDNVQPAGKACDVCGRPFPGGGGVDAPVEPLLDLEPTLLFRVEADGDPVEGLEATAVAPVQVVAAAMEGFLPTAAEGIPDDGRSGEPVVVICRYCRTPGFPGESFCAHCGMRLPPAYGAGGDGPGPVLCRDCGTPVRGNACPSCGVRPFG